jgi:BON domain
MGILGRLSLIVGALVAVFYLLPEADGTVASIRREPRSPGSAPALRTAHVDEAQAIERELAETGRVVRRQDPQPALTPAEKAEDRRTTAAIEAQLATDPHLASLAIGVDTTDGTVTLAGRVESTSDVAHAIQLALRHSGVREVISTLQVAPGL